MTNRQLALLGYDAQDYTTCQALMKLSSWSKAPSQPPLKEVYHRKFTNIEEGCLMKALLASECVKEPGSDR